MAAIDDLRNLITRVGTGLQMKPAIARSLTSGSIDAQITRLNAAASTGEKDRIKLLEAESELLRKNNVLHRSNAIFRGYDVMRRFPNRFSSASQAGAWEQAMNRIANPNRSRLSDLQEQFGLYGGSRIFRETAFDRYYKDLTKIGKSKWELRREELFEEYGGTEDPNAGRRADNIVSRERSEEAKRLRHSRHLKSLAAERAYKFDLMDEYDQEISTLKEKYGGGTVGRRRAEEVWQRGVFKEFRWLRPIAKNIPSVGRNLPVIAKTLREASHAPIIGKFVKHPVLAPLAMGGYAMSQWSSALNSVLASENIRTVYGTPSQALYGAASAVGMDFKEASKLSGTTRSFLGRLRTSSEGWEKMASAAVYGFDVRKISPNMTDDEFLKELYRQTSTMSESDRLNTLKAIGMPENSYLVGQGLASPRSQRTTEQINTEWIQKQITARDYKLAHGSSLEKLLAYLSPDWGFKAQAFFTPDKLLQMDLDAWDRTAGGESAFSAFFNTLKAAFSADEYRSNAGASGTGNVNVTIQTLQTNASTYKDLMTDIATVGITDPSTRKAIIDSFDTLGE